MAKSFAIQFYRSKAWKTLRGIALRRDHFSCCRCNGRAEEVHHKIELTADNIHDDSIALNIDLLECLCHDCHTKETKGDTGDVELQYEFDDSGQVVRRTPPV